MGFDLTGASTGAASWGAAGTAVGGPVGGIIGAIGGGVIGGVLGGKSAAKQKAAARLLRETRAIERMTARRMSIVDAIQQGAVAQISGYGAGYNPEGTSSAVGVQQSIYGQEQSNLKTEAMVWNRKVKAENLIGQAAKYNNQLALFNSVAAAVPSIKNTLGGLTPPKTGTSYTKGTPLPSSPFNNPSPFAR
jgi:hypothetical protein